MAESRWGCPEVALHEMGYGPTGNAAAGLKRIRGSSGSPPQQQWSLENEKKIVKEVYVLQ